MLSDKFFLIKEESNYNVMIETLFKEANIPDYIESKHSKWVCLLNKQRVQKILGWCINLFMRKKYGIYNFFKQINIDTQKKYIIFLNSSFINSHYSPQVMQYYKRKWPNMVFVLLYIDVVSHPVSRHANLLREKGVFDLIYTVDKNDAKKYSMFFTRTPYSKVKKLKRNLVKKDIYFCGVTKDRGNMIIEILDKAIKNHIAINMDIYCNDLEKKRFSDRECVNVLSDYVNYLDLLEKTIDANCILDLVQTGQTALTLRPYEAVVYNRKLLTNNKAIFDFEFYNEKYMKYFESVSDIDWRWIMEKCEIDYGYKNQFSPNKFINRIINDEENRTWKKNQ